MAVIMPTGIPARSISLANVAPQRLQLPHVATSKTPSTRLALNSAAISPPMRRAALTAVALPVVEKNCG